MIIYHTLSWDNSFVIALRWRCTQWSGTVLEGKVLVCSSTMVRTKAMPPPITTGVIPLTSFIDRKTQFVWGWRCASCWRATRTPIWLPNIFHINARKLAIITTWKLYCTLQSGVCKLAGIVDYSALLRRWRRCGSRCSFPVVWTAQPGSDITSFIGFFWCAHPSRVCIT